MRIILCECKKFCAFRVFWVLLIALLSVSAYVQLNGENDRYYTAADYRAFFSDTADMNLDETQEYVESLLDEMVLGTVPPYPSMLLYDMDELCENCRAYPDYLASIFSSADNMASVSLWGGKDSYSYRNIEKTPSAYASLSAEILPLAPSLGLEDTFTASFTDVCVVVLVFVCVCVVILRDREQGMTALLSSTSGGRLRLFAAKGMLLALVTVALAILFIGENFLIGAYSYGLGDLSRPIQSVYGFTACNLPLTVWQYLGIFVLLKIGAYLVFAAVFSLIACAAKNNLLVYAISAAFVAVFAVLYLFVPETSVFALLHYWNPVAFTQVTEIWDTYRNVNLFGYPISQKISSCLVLVLLLIAATVAAALIFSHTPHSTFRTISLSFRISRRVRVYPRFCYVIYRALILHRGALILFCAVLAVGLVSASWTRPYSNDEICYENFTEAYSGSVTQDTLDFIVEKRTHYEEVREELDTLYAQDSPSLYRITLLEGELNDESALERFAERVEAIADTGGEIFYDTGYERLFALDGNHEDMVSVLILLIAIVLIVSPVPAADRRTRITHILFASSFGRRGYFGDLMLFCVLLSLFASLWTGIPYVCTLLSQYGTQGLDAPIQSLISLAACPLPVTVGVLIVLLFVRRIVGVVLVSVLATLIASRCKTILSAYLINLTVWVLPCVLVLIGVDWMYYVPFLPLLTFRL